jgi:predicted nuclease of predicted toxin-antitoxin system
MKLLLDENLSRRLVPFLQDAYPGSTQVALIGLERATDRDIWDFAGREGFTVVSRDEDFEQLAATLGPPPHVVWIKTPNQTKAATLSLLLNNRAAIERALQDEGLACVELRAGGQVQRS